MERIRTYLGAFIGILLLAISMLTPVSSWAAGKKLALLIGNSKYENLPSNGQLKTPANDVVAAGKKFEELGFTTDVYHNLGRAAFLDAVRGFRRKLGEGDIAVFYYAGHGVAFQSFGVLLLPSDIPAPARNDREDEERIADLAVRESQVLDIITGSGAKVVLAIIDACRNNPLDVDGAQTREFGGTRGLPAIPTHDQVDGLAVLYSAGRNQTALDRLRSDSTNDPNLTSVFARVFLQQISTRGLSIEAIGDNMRREVERLAKTEIDEKLRLLTVRDPRFRTS